jgi:hypothetical protein
MSASPLDLLLPNLEGVRRTGKDRYVARCPAHGDRHPSLAVRETDDGVLLLHCFAGCDIGSVVRAVGLEISSLFPQKELASRKPDRRPFSANDLLVLAAWESLIASVIANDIAQGKLTDKERLVIAAGRLQHIAEVANVR